LSWPAAAEEEIAEVMPADEAAGTMIVPDGFRVTLFAGEPDVQQPIGFCIDDRGRLWVAEAYSYPNHTAAPGKDRIVILDDADGDGRFDDRTVFFEGLNYVTGVEVGFGGAWVMSPPFFYFIPDRDGDDAPDGPPEVVLDGFGNHANAHNLANGFAWGPDGWLYGTHGRTNWSLIGKPGAPDEERGRFDGGVWRYHPVRDVWEPFADGTTNPWGIDWDDYGQGFVCNCVNPHLFHVIQGAHYEPWRNRESSQYAYQRIDTIADHLHFVGGDNVRAGLGSHDEDVAGGGHAHCGTMVYLGDNWPEAYRNTVFMNNIHGRRINNDLLRRAGSGYIASHGPDLMRSQDPWYMGVTLQYGPDGAVYASDWSDTGECHSVKNTQRQTGRIFKIAYKTPAPFRGDISELEDQQLVELQLHRNDWHVRHARRVLQERAAAGRDMSAVREALFAMFAEQNDVTRQLRAMWTLHAIGALDDEVLIRQLSHPSQYIRGWAIQLLCEDKDPPREALERFRGMAASDESPLVRLYLASALQRLAPLERWPIAEALLSRGEDAGDANLPLMIWYAVEPLVEEDLDWFITLAAEGKLPIVRQFAARRAISSRQRDDALDVLAQILESASREWQADLLAGMLQGLEGVRSTEMPHGWPAAYAQLETSPDASVREQALELALVFDDPAALRALRARAADPSVPAEVRVRAVEAMVAKKPADLAMLLFDLLRVPDLQSVALRGLAEFEEPGTIETILENYPNFSAAARQDALQTLASRRSWAIALLDAIESGAVPRGEVTAFTARQLQSLGDEQLTARLVTLWGEVRTTPAEKARLIADYKRRISTESLLRADRAAGRAVFEKTCANCHRFFDAGGNIGPDITGAQRTNLDYLLENLLDPSAAVSKDYQMEVIETAAGRVITGLVAAKTDNALTIQTANEKVIVPLNEIENRELSPLSLMPDGLLQQLTLEQVRDLLAYLSGPAQAPSREAGGE
jgi:putative membrane-bound dehydrogenase-like protein